MKISIEIITHLKSGRDVVNVAESPDMPEQAKAMFISSIFRTMGQMGGIIEDHADQSATYYPMSEISSIDVREKKVLIANLSDLPKQ